MKSGYSKFRYGAPLCSPRVGNNTPRQIGTSALGMKFRIMTSIKIASSEDKNEIISTLLSRYLVVVSDKEVHLVILSVENSGSATHGHIR